MRKKKLLSTNRILLFFLVIATLFISVGYASVNSVTMDINGNAIAKAQSGVYITEVNYESDVNADLENSKIKNAYQTMLSSSIVLSDTDSNSSITYSITVYNSSNYTYYFNKVDYLTDDTTYSNSDINFKLDGLNVNDSINSKESMTFNITFYYKDYILATDNTLDSYLNFIFKRNCTISYVNIAEASLPTSILEGETLNLNLETKAPSSIEVYIDDSLITEYTYIGNVLTIDNVSGNVKIVGVLESPNLSSSSLIPVSYDGDDWRVVSTESEWYDYGKQEWGNAVVLKSGITLEVGDVVDISNDVRAMFVWIPRYEYKISTDGSNEIFINFISKNQTTATDGYIIHPAFTFGTTELNGIWVGKFETSPNKNSSCYTSTSFDNCNTYDDGDVYILPNVKSLREQTISTQFNTARNFGQYLNDNSINSHMLKNSEWAVVGYLSQSKYGKYGNLNYTGSNKEIYVNNNSGLYTGFSSGTYFYQDKSFEYNYGFDHGVFIGEENGVGASTTGNITGIYDMNGGAYEYVMGYLSTASSNFGSTSYYDYAGFSSTPESKYYDSYTSSTSSIACNGRSCYGHGFDETSGWYDDAADFITADNPWVMRGGVIDSGVSGGIFAYSGTIGYSGAYATFRIALVEE